MINLLPTELKTAYSYGRRNVGLRKWVAIFAVALVGLGLIGTFGLLSIKQSGLDYQRQVATAQKALNDDHYEATQKQVKDISNNFKLVIKVLGQEVLFSQLLKQIAATIPANASLTGLNISQVQGGIDISAVATDYNTASQVQVNLADTSNKIFSKADLVSISCQANTDSAAPTKYPCSVDVRALFATNNPYLFINSKGTK
jgi:hypothetical protein